MSMHKVPLTPTEEAGLHAHGLQRNIGKPSQLADVFRQGVAWGIAAERERCAKECDDFAREYDACAASEFCNQHGAEWMKRAAEWARNMGAAIRGSEA